jgi:hypothetical protein
MTAPTRRATATITVTIPMSLAPMSLSKNGRAHWRVRHRAFQDQKEWVWATVREQQFWPCPPVVLFDIAILDIDWRYARGRPPDDDNAVARVAAARDAFEDAGVVEDDKDIRIGTVTFTKVKTGYECVVVSLRKEGAP